MLDCYQSTDLVLTELSLLFQDELDSHSKNHAVNGATGSYRCNFCDYTVLEEQSQLYEHIQLHFQLKGRVKLESYWKCSNLEIWSEPVTTAAASSSSSSSHPLRMKYANEMQISRGKRKGRSDRATFAHLSNR